MNNYTVDTKNIMFYTMKAVGALFLISKYSMLMHKYAD